eukprot:3556391-Pleurochrysis_carterae.AAC.1
MHDEDGDDGADYGAAAAAAAAAAGGAALARGNADRGAPRGSWRMLSSFCPPKTSCHEINFPHGKGVAMDQAAAGGQCAHEPRWKGSGGSRDVDMWASFTFKVPVWEHQDIAALPDSLLMGMLPSLSSQD